MVASSSNLLLVASTANAGHLRTGSTIPNDHDLTSEVENRLGYMIRSTSTNHIRGSSSGTNLKEMLIMLETVAPTYASAPASTLASSSATPPTVTQSEEKPRLRPRRKKMVSIGVDAMKMMLVTSSSVVVALPESPTLVSRKHDRAGEQRDDIDSQFNNIRSTSTRKVLAFDLSTPSMPDMMSMPALPTPVHNRSNKLQHETSNSNNDDAPMKKKKNHMGKRLRQIKKRLTLKSKSGSNKSSSTQVEDKEVVCLSPGTSATTSTSTFGQPSSSEDENVLSMDDMMTMNMTTALQPRIHSMFHEEEEDMMMMPMMMPVLPALPCPLSTAPDEVVTTPSVSFSSTLDKSLSVLSPSNGDDDGNEYGNDDGDDAVADDTADEWGIFASYDDDQEDHHDQDIEPKYNNLKSKTSSRSSFTKHHATTNPCFPPRARLPIFAATAGAE